MKRILFCLSVLGGSILITGFSENHLFNDSLIQNAFPCPDAAIPQYKAEYTSHRPLIDGKLDEPLWKDAARSVPFRDLISGTKAHFDTRAAVIWDDEHLYVAYWIEEPDVKATLTERDAPIYRDNDVELFIASGDGYYEFEINAYATIYEVLFFWEDAFQRNGYASMPEFNRNDSLARRFNGVGFNIIAASASVFGAGIIRGCRKPFTLMAL